MIINISVLEMSFSMSEIWKAVYVSTCLVSLVYVDLAREVTTNINRGQLESRND